MRQLNTFQPISPPQPIQPPTPQEDTGHPRRSAYAAMSDLQERFSIAGIETDQVWENFKSEYSINSRSLLTGLQWATIAARLNSARRETDMFKVLIDSIPDDCFRIHVFTNDPNVCIGRPRDLRKHHIAAEWGDFQAIANENQCTLTVLQGKRTTHYEPKRQMAQNHRFLTGIKATLKVSGKWETAPSVFHHFYDKYNLVELRDIEIGLDGLAKAGEIQTKVVDGEKQYHLPTSDFERLLDRCQVSRYHLAETTMIDEAVMCGYCKGAKISAADARMVADKLNIELSELDGIVEVRTAQKTPIALDTNARGEVLSAWGEVLEVQHDV